MNTVCQDCGKPALYVSPDSTEIQESFGPVNRPPGATPLYAKQTAVVQKNVCAGCYRKDFAKVHPGKFCPVPAPTHN